MVQIILWMYMAENQLNSGGLRMYCPSSYILVSGVGNDKFQLVSFDKALFASKIANYNLVKVSSILPPNCKEEYKITARQGSILFTAYASVSSCEQGILSAAVGVGIPQSTDEIGVIMEFSCRDSESVAIHQVREMVKNSMELRKIRIQEIRIASAEVIVSDGLYSTALAALAMW